MIVPAKEACEPVSLGLNDRIRQMDIKNDLWRFVMWCHEMWWDMIVPLSLRPKSDSSQQAKAVWDMIYEDVWCDVM